MRIKYFTPILIIIRKIIYIYILVYQLLNRKIMNLLNYILKMYYINIKKKLTNFPLNSTLKCEIIYLNKYYIIMYRK